jgi:hypothetical protein
LIVPCTWVTWDPRFPFPRGRVQVYRLLAATTGGLWFL